MISTVFPILGGMMLAWAFCILFPLYVGIQAWRKGRRTAATLVYASLATFYLAPLAALIVFFVCRIYEPNLDAAPRLSSYAGFGTAFCGATDREADGSFLTTEWLRFLFIPMVPIQSYRVIFAGMTTSFNAGSHSETRTFYIQEKRGLSIKHVLRTYALIVGAHAALFGLLALSPPGANLTPWQMLAMTVLLIVAAVLGVRFWRAR